MIKLGQEVQDKITGFKGVVTGIVEYISGCNQALVMPKVAADGKFPDGNWLDIQRLESTGAPEIRLDNSAMPGCDVAPPIR